jgi:uncharacterized OB-fold protein
VRRRRCSSGGGEHVSGSIAQSLWTAWSQGRLVFQRCDTCLAAQHPPGPVCSSCHATTLSLAEVSGDAEILAWSRVHRAPSPRFGEDIPYTLLVVRIPAGALVEARMLPDLDPDDTHESDGTDSWRAGTPCVLQIAEVGGVMMPVVSSLRPNGPTPRTERV